LLSKIDNLSDSLKYAKQAKESFEKELRIKKGKNGPSFKLLPHNKSEIQEIQKKLTNYAISLHMIAKSMKGLEKYDASKEFLNRALFVADTFLPTPNPKLVETIKSDIDSVNGDIRTLPIKRKIEDADELLEKLSTLMVNKNKPDRSSPDAKPERKSTRTPSEK
jgi:hypothetical protein